MQRHELEAWLGPALDELTDEQIDRLATDADDISTRHPHDDDARTAALSAAVQYLLGEVDIDQAGSALLAARRVEADAYAAAQQLAAMAVTDGMPEAEAARRAGIDRMTVRKVLGKR